MKPGDIVRVRPWSVWYAVVGDAEGTVLDVVAHVRLASIRFEALELTAERWRWEELTIVPRRDAEPQR